MKPLRTPHTDVVELTLERRGDPGSLETLLSHWLSLEDNILQSPNDTVGPLFVEAGNVLGLPSTPRDGMDIQRIVQTITPMIDELRDTPLKERSTRIFKLIYRR